ncbi:putative aconitate hydratase [Helianthus annuus]|nr:putative aconitate hydratase [Helianthus annuus]
MLDFFLTLTPHEHGLAWCCCIQVVYKATNWCHDHLFSVNYLTVTQMLRKHGVVGKFVEFYGNVYVASNQIICKLVVSLTVFNITID